jgi:hypothetical protein
VLSLLVVATYYLETKPRLMITRTFFRAGICSVLAFARIVFEDTYMLIHDTDGQEWADSLRYRMHENASEPITEKSGLIMSA